MNKYYYLFIIIVFLIPFIVGIVYATKKEKDSCTQKENRHISTINFLLCVIILLLSYIIIRVWIGNAKKLNEAYETGGIIVIPPYEKVKQLVDRYSNSNEKQQFNNEFLKLVGSRTGITSY